MRDKIYFLLTIVTLAIGIAGIVLSSLFYMEEKSYDTWNPNKDDVFAVETQLRKGASWMSLSLPFGAKLKELSPFVEDYLYMNNFYESGILKYNGETIEYKKGLEAQSSFFNFFPFEFVRGSREQAFIVPKSIVIKDTYATYLFKDKDPIGEVLYFGEDAYTVSGVYTIGNARSSVDANFILNGIDKLVENGSDSWGNYSQSLWLKLNDPEKKEVIEKMIYDIMYEYYLKSVAQQKGVTIEELLEKNGEEKPKFTLHDLGGQRMVEKAHLNATPEGAASVNRIYILIALSVLIMILAAFNYINLTMARSIARGKEVGVRKTLGASITNLISQGLFEALLTVCVALIFSLVIIEFMLPWLRVFLKAELKFSLAMLPLLLGVAVGMVLLVGFIPALFMARFKTLEVLKGGVGKSKKGVVFKNSLLVLQFAVACFFMTGAYIVYEQVAYMLEKDLGFSGEQIITIPYDYKGENVDMVAVYQGLKEELIKIKGVEKVTAASVEIASMGGISRQFVYNDNKVQARVAAMDYNFLDVYNIGIKEGRAILENLATDSISNVLLNEKAIWLMQEPNPIGKEIEWGDKKLTVVGVVQDFNLFALNEDYPPMVFFSLKMAPWAAESISSISIKIDGAHVEKVISELEEVWKRRDLSRVVFQYEFVDKRFAETFSDSVQERNIFLVLSGVVIFIALFGLYSLASFTINSRLKEVSIRKVLGASSSELLKQLSAQYVWYCLIGFGIAVFPSYYFAEKWLSNYAFRIEIEWLVYVVCLFTILLLTLGVVLSRAYAATKVDVLKYLKYE